MFRDIGHRSPLIIVLLSMVISILLFKKAYIPAFYCTAFLFMSLSRPLVLHAVLGLAIGLVAALLQPGSMDIVGEYQVKARVVSSGFVGGTYRLRVDRLLVDNKKIRGVARISVLNNVRPIMSGSLVRARVTLGRHGSTCNEGGFDYTRYLESKGIVLTGFIKNSEDIEITRAPPAQGFRQRVSGLLSGMCRPEAEILRAILLGDRSGLTDSIKDSFAKLGISHLLAISGLHLGLVMLFGTILTFNIIRALPFVAKRVDTPLVARLFGVLAALLYALFVEVSLPTMRATIMAIVLLGSIALNSKADLVNALSLAGIVILALWPFSIFSISLMLSFASVLGIAGVLKKVPLKGYFFTLVAITVGATVFTLPLVVYVFGSISPVGFIANLLFVPLFGMLVMPAGILGMICLPVSTGVAYHLFQISMYSIGLVLMASSKFGLLLPVIRPWPAWVYLVYMGLFLAFFGERTVIRHIFLYTCIVLVACMPVLHDMVIRSGRLTFDFIDVGHGESILITKKGHAILIDSGGSYMGPDTGRLIVYPHLLYRRIRCLDLFVITSSSPYHSGGAAFILQRFPVRRVWTSMIGRFNPIMRDVARIARMKSIPVECVSLGVSMDIGDMSIEVLNPRRCAKTNHSLARGVGNIVLRVGDDEMKGLFMSDADGDAELSIAHLDGDISANVLKVANFGSERSCFPVFLERVRPEIAVITCPDHGKRHRVSTAVLKRLKQRSVLTFRTDTRGEVIVEFNKVFSVKSARKSADN